MKRFAFGLTVVFGLFATLPATGAEGNGAQAPKEVRARRIIFDNDGNDPRDAKSLSPEDVLAARTTGLAGTQVDTILFCTNSGFGESRRPSKVWPHAETGKPNHYLELEKSGTDILRLMVEFGHKHGMEVFSNVRMNDVHDGAPGLPDGERFQNNPFKSAHPELLLNAKRVYRKPRTGSWTAVNYARPEVRESMFRYLEEACQNYDIDGLHLDFFRHPCFFRSTFLGKVCTDEERAAMTELIGKVSAMVRDTGRKRGRALLLSVRVPDSPAYCRDIGLDVEGWLGKGWVDLLAVSSYFQLADWSESVALGRKYGVPVYPSLDEARTKDAAALALRTTLNTYRGRAAAAWGAGVSGIMLFNWTDPASPHWRELGDAKALAGMDKDYFASVRGPGLANGGHLPYATYVTGELLHPDAPRTVESGKPATARIRLGAMETKGAECTIRLRFSRSPALETLRVEVNNLPVASLREAGEWVEGTLQAEAHKLMAPALHEVKVSLREGAEKVSWLDLMVTERHPAAGSQ